MNSDNNGDIDGAIDAALARGEQFEAMRARLHTDGWLYIPGFQPKDDGGEQMLRLARRLGPLYRIRGTDSTRPIVDTSASRDAPYDAPFDRIEAIGWHNDFSTHRVRPRWSLSYVRCEDAAGGGNWRVATVDRVLDGLGSERPGVLRTLRERLPYSFTGEGEPSWHCGLVRQRLRFYGRALRDGARLADGAVPARTEEAIHAIESAADREGIALRAETGALLVVDNWRVLHDRTAQTGGERRTALAFVVG